MDFQTSIFSDFAYHISPYEISKNEKMKKLSAPTTLLQKLALKKAAIQMNVAVSWYNNCNQNLTQQFYSSIFYLE